MVEVHRKKDGQREYDNNIPIRIKRIYEKEDRSYKKKKEIALILYIIILFYYYPMSFHVWHFLEHVSFPRHLPPNMAIWKQRPPYVKKKKNEPLTSHKAVSDSVRHSKRRGNKARWFW